MHRSSIGQVSHLGTHPPLWLMPDAYTVYIKMDGDTKHGKLVYTRSERQLLDVVEPSGKSFGKDHAALFPPIEWSLQRLSAQDGEPAGQSSLSTNGMLDTSR